MATAMVRHILIVDDSASMRQLLSETTLRVLDQGAQTAGKGPTGSGTRSEPPLGVEIAEAMDGLDALKRLTTGHFDLIFVDVNMPLLDGLKLIARIRKSSTSRNTKICVCTTEDETESQARQLGADFFLKKPVRRKDVEEILRSVFPCADKAS